MSAEAQFSKEQSSDGEFRRQVSRFRLADGEAPESAVEPVAGRYHLYVSLACPWAHLATYRLDRARRELGLTSEVRIGDVVDPDDMVDVVQARPGTSIGFRRA